MGRKAKTPKDIIQAEYNRVIWEIFAVEIRLGALKEQRDKLAKALRKLKED